MSLKYTTHYRTKPLLSSNEVEHNTNLFDLPKFKCKLRVKNFFRSLLHLT